MNELSKLASVDPIMAEALLGGLHGNGPGRAERELLVAVLADAIECYWKYHNSRSGSGIRLFQEAKAWLFGDKETHTITFAGLCEAIGLDPGYIRRGILSWRDAHLQASDKGVASGDRLRYRNMKRKLKGGRDWKGTTRLSRQRVRPLTLQTT